MSSYLSRIQFDPRLNNSIHGKYLTNFRLALLLIVSILVIGIVNYMEIPRRLNPEVKIPIVTVSTVLPGATPEDIEQLVTIPLEEKLKSAENMDIITSQSRENVSLIVLQFLSTVEPDQAQTDVQQIVDTVADLPDDALDPNVNAVDFENQPIWVFALTSNDIPSLMSVSENLKNELEDVAKVDRVQVTGFENQEIQVIIDPIKIAEYGITPIQLSQTLSNASNSFPAGSVKANGSSFSLTIDPQIKTIDDIRSLQISSQDGIISLSDFAQIREASAADQKKSFISSNTLKPQRAVQFFVYKTKGSNIDEAETEAHAATEAFLKPYEGSIQQITIRNTADEIQNQFSDLIREFGTTVFLIFIVLLIFMGLRQALIASFTVPLTFLSAIAIANAFGQSLNFLTLFSFLIALGLLIDDTIVVVTAMTRYYASGKFTPSEAGLLVWRDFITPLWSTTATTIWSFVPLLLATGIIGEFIKPIPIIITATMLSSTTIAVLITIPLLIVFLKFTVPRRVQLLLRIVGVLIAVAAVSVLIPKTIFAVPVSIVLGIFALLLYFNRVHYLQAVNKQYRTIPNLSVIKSYVLKIINQGVVNIESISFRYKKLLDSILISKRKRRMTLIFLTVFALVSYLLVPLGFVKNEFFPKTDEDTVYLSVSLPSGTGIETTTSEVQNIINQIRTMENVNYVTGEAGYNLNTDGDRDEKESSLLLTIDLAEDRTKSSIEIAEELRNTFATYAKGDLVIIELSGGPPAGADIQIKYLGDEYGPLNSFADQTIAYLKSQPGVTNVDKSITSGTSKIVFVPDDAKITAAGISRSEIGLWLRTYATGFTLDTIRFDEEKDINLKLTAASISPEEIGSLSLSTKSAEYPLLSLGNFELGSNPTSITHEDTLRTISVSATVTQGFSITDINKDLESFADTLDLSNGYSWKTGGVNDENQKSVTSIIQAMGLSFLLILITMVVVFGSYRQATIVMLSIPLAVSGVFYVFGLTGTPLSFPALIGILALFGIVVTNAIVVVAKINSNIAEGIDLKESILDAAGSRLEPVLLTSLTTIFGLLPITLSDPLWRGLGGAIISGLFFSGMIKLFFIPVVYFSWYKK